MKIIGKTEGGYIAAVSQQEIAKIAGFYSAYDDDFMRQLDAYRDGGLVEGAEIPVSDLWRRLEDLRSREQEVKKAAESLRFLAKLMEDALPTIVAPPPAEPERQGDAA